MVWEAQRRWVRAPGSPTPIFPQPSTTLMILSQVSFPQHGHLASCSSMTPAVGDSPRQGRLEAVRPFSVLDSQTCPFPQMKLWRLPAAGQVLPSGPGLVLGPEDTQVEVLQFHPTVDGILLSTAGTAVKVWDVAKQRPLTELAAHGDLVQGAVWSWDGALVSTTCKVSRWVVRLK